MSSSRVEQRVRGFMSPLVAAMDALGISPNALTVLGLFLNFGAAWVVATGELVYGAVAFLVASAFDMLDGSLARRRGQASRLGAFLDSTFDRLSETALFTALLIDHARTPYGPDWMAPLILVALALHVYYNWKPLTQYLKNRARQWKILTPEFNLAAVLVVVFTVGTLAGWPPFTTILALQDDIKAAAARKYGEPPYGHAELSSLKVFARKTGLNLEDALMALAASGFKVTDPEQSLQEMASANGVSPQTIYNTMMKVPSAAALHLVGIDPAGQIEAGRALLGRVEEHADVIELGPLDEATKLLEVRFGLARMAHDEGRAKHHVSDRAAQPFDHLVHPLATMAAPHCAEHRIGGVLKRHVDVGKNLVVAGEHIDQRISQGLRV